MSSLKAAAAATYTTPTKTVRAKMVDTCIETIHEHDEIQELSKREMEAVEGGLRFSRVVAPEDSDIDIPFSGFSQNGPQSYTY